MKFTCWFLLIFFSKLKWQFKWFFSRDSPLKIYRCSWMEVSSYAVLQMEICSELFRQGAWTFRSIRWVLLLKPIFSIFLHNPFLVLTVGVQMQHFLDTPPHFYFSPEWPPHILFFLLIPPGTFFWIDLRKTLFGIFIPNEYSLFSLYSFFWPLWNIIFMNFLWSFWFPFRHHWGSK